MKLINIIVEGTSEEIFVKDVLEKHFTPMGKYVSARKIRTGWDKNNNKPAKGGLSSYGKFQKEVQSWIFSDKGRPNCFYTSFIDLYAFPKGQGSPYKKEIQNITNPYERIKSLEEAILRDINDPRFIPYVQLHEFEAFLLTDPDKLLTMYPDQQHAVNKLIKNIGSVKPEEINENPQTSPSKRIIKYLPAYEGQKAQVGPLVSQEIGINILRDKCPHFNEWITKLENI